MRRLKYVSIIILAILAAASVSGPAIAQAEVPLTAQPGISIPRCTDLGTALFWHTRDRGDAEAPAGWRVERRHWDGGWVTRAWEFIGADADALQKFSNRYWDWTDTTAERRTNYTYRVIAIGAEGDALADRRWSRRAPEDCV